jgi:hypothetical protein
VGTGKSPIRAIGHHLVELADQPLVRTEHDRADRTRKPRRGA